MQRVTAQWVPLLMELEWGQVGRGTGCCRTLWEWGATRDSKLPLSSSRNQFLDLKDSSVIPELLWDRQFFNGHFPVISPRMLPEIY